MIFWKLKIRFPLLITSIIIHSLSLFSQQNPSLSFQSNLTFQNEVLDLWGYTAQDQKEYAIVTHTHGTSIVDLSDINNPKELIDIKSKALSPWRDAKTWKNYAYIVHDFADLGGSLEGLLIVDLSNLPDTTNINTTIWTANGFRRAHNIFIDDDGYLYLVGGNLVNGGVLIADLNENPMNPEVIGTFGARYVHDCYVKDTLLYAANELDNSFSIINISDKSNPTLLRKRSTDEIICHNLWTSMDGKTLFVTHESPNSSISAYDVTDFNNIDLLDKYKSSPGQSVTPHNVFEKYGFLFASYYKDGAIVLDGSNPSNLIELDRYDTAPALSGSGTNGCWGIYPYFKSGTIIASDMNNGLFVFKFPLVEVDSTICKGEKFFAGGAFHTENGIYFDTIKTTNGYDSIVVTNLNVVAYHIEIGSSFCQGDSILFNGNYIKSNISLTDSLLSINVCDSIVQYNFIIDSNCIVSGLFDQKIETLKFYPNPLKKELKFSLPSPIKTPSTITLYTLSGQALKSIPLMITKQHFNLEIDFLPDGMYYAIISDKKSNIFRGKFLKRQ